MDFLKTLTGKVISGIVGLAVVSLGITWWRMDEFTRQMILSSSGKILAWVGIVGLLPWATFFITAWVAKFDSNLAGGALVLIFTGTEAWLLTWLFRGFHPGPTGWTFFGVGTLLAGVYNLLICDWIAEKVE